MSATSESPAPALSLHERIAKVCHEANRAWSEVNGDTSHVPWEQAPEWQRSSAIEGVHKALAGATAEELHESWCASKINQGWVYGPRKDFEKLTHPCLVAYSALPPEQRQKDRLFRAITQTLGCGQERWNVKTGTDPDASSVVMAAKSTTIAELVAFRAPPPDPPSRVAGEPECQVYVLEATVTACKMEADSDYHLALADDQGNTMIAEAACPGCSTGSPWLDQITAARAAVEAAIPDITEEYQDVNRKATLTGVGFFDRIHGQRGVATNGIELHPLLSIEFH